MAADRSSPASLTPVVFDRALVRARRTAALARSGGAADFLSAAVIPELADRLSLITRRFSASVVLAAGARQFATALGMPERIGLPLAADVTDHPGADLVCDEEALPFAQGSLDCIISGLTLHWVNDLPGALIQMRRALRPDGLLLAAMFGGDTLSELRTSLLLAEAQSSSGASPRVSPFLDIRDAGALLQRAGFALPVVDADRLTVRYADPLTLMRDLKAMGAGNALVSRSRRPLRRSVLMDACEAYVQQFSDPDGRVRATFQIIYLIGWAPHENQQKPLRPGSAKARLADALNTVEHKLPRWSERIAQVRDQRQVGGRHRIIPQIEGLDPSKFLAFARSHGAGPAAADIKRHQQVEMLVSVAGEG